MQKFNIPDTIINHLNKDGVIAYATESVFGLGCSPYSEQALQYLLALKQRPLEKGLILIAAQIKQLSDFANFESLPKPTQEMIYASWPNAITWVVPARSTVSPLITGKRHTVAVRVSAHPQVQALCQAFGHPLTSTSANRSGFVPCKSMEAVKNQFGDSIEILPGQVGEHAQPSEIRDALTGKTLRPS